MNHEVIIVISFNSSAANILELTKKSIGSDDERQYNDNKIVRKEKT